MAITTKDGKEFNPAESKLVGSVKAVRDRVINTPAKIGEYPVFVEQSGKYRMFTYNRKLVSTE